MKKIGIILTIAMLMVQCKKENHFLIDKNKIGNLESTTQVYELEALFASDSLVVRLGEGDFADSSYDEYLVYSKKGEQLLSIIPKEQHDSTATIDHVQILNTKFKSEKGLGLASTFKDIVDMYSVSKVEDAISVAQISIDELNATVTIDKKELGLNDFSSHKIVVEQIPDMAKIKTLTIWFE